MKNVLTISNKVVPLHYQTANYSPLEFRIMTTKTISGHEVRNLQWHDEGIKGYYGEVFKDGEWAMFMWNDKGQTGNKAFDIIINPPTLAEAYEAGLEYHNQWPETPKTNEQVKQSMSRLQLAQLHYNPSQKTAFSIGMRDGRNGQKIQWDAFFNACKELDKLLSVVHPLGFISVFQFRMDWGITGEETQGELKEMAQDYISECETERCAEKHEWRYDN